jgi:hypothetical protein
MVRGDSREIATHNLKPSVCPQIAGNVSECGIEFDANGAADSLGAEYSKRRRKEAARADRWVAEPNIALVSTDD